MDSYYEGAVTKMAAPASRLTGADRDIVARARKLAAASTADEVREYAGETDTSFAYADAFGQARRLLAELAAIAERVAGDA